MNKKFAVLSTALILTTAWAIAAGGLPGNSAENDAPAPAATDTKRVAAHSDPAPVDMHIPAITVVDVRRQRLIERVIASGLIEPVEQVYVQPEIEGQAIRSLAVDVGDKVVAGQTLATLAATSLDLQKSQLEAQRAASKAAIAQAEAQFVEAQSTADEAVRNRDRVTSLAKRGMVSQANLDQAVAAVTASAARANGASQNLKAARAQLEGAQAQIGSIDFRLSRTAITAPVAGTVIRRNARVGAIATAAGEPMFVLMRDHALEVRADVAERDLLRVVAGQTARVQVAGLAAPIEATVRLVEPTVDATSRLGRIRISLPVDSVVRAGMFADAIIEVAHGTSLVLPISALGVSGAGPTVLRVDDGLVKRVPVVTGARDGGQIAILDGLVEGTTVVARAGAFVRDGDRIRPVRDVDVATGAAR